MPSLIAEYNYDIFISYRQKDNKYDGWVTEFVDHLQKELESTFKEDISVYFDINPHDGLLESYEVGDSLKEKLKCLIFIPIISRTYCDPKSFAWEHEFKAFVEIASNDKFGMKVKLPGGNVASRVLPVRIYDLNKEDIQLFESVLGGVLRGIEFIYKSAGVNRPLRANEDHARDNLNKTYYRDQINKLSHSVQEIIQGLRPGKDMASKEEIQEQKTSEKFQRREFDAARRRPVELPWKKILATVFVIAVLIAVVVLYPKVSKSDKSSGLKSEEILGKAINIVDYMGHWNNYSGKIHLVTAQINGDFSEEVIEIQTKEGYYKCTSDFGNVRIVKGIKNGECFREINGNPNPGEEQIKQYGLECESIKFWREYHTYTHFGMLMGLKASGLILDENAPLTKFQSNNCYALTFTCDTSKVKISAYKGLKMTVFIDPENFEMKGFLYDGILNKKGYAVCAGNLRVNGIIIPVYKAYYNIVDNSFMAIDLVSLVK